MAGSKSAKPTFSEASYFKTVFSTAGDDLVRQDEQDRLNELKEWESKVVVANKHFKVDLRVPKSNQKDKIKSILQDPVNKKGLALPGQRVKLLAKRQIAACKSLKEMPVSALMNEPYVMNEQAIKPLKTKVDFTQTPFKKETGERESQDFLRYSRSSAGILVKNSSSRIPILPLTEAEKVGPKFGK